MVLLQQVMITMYGRARRIALAKKIAIVAVLIFIVYILFTKVFVKENFVIKVIYVKEQNIMLVDVIKKQILHILDLLDMMMDLIMQINLLVID